MVLGDDDQLVDGRSLAVDVPTDDNLARQVTNGEEMTVEVLRLGCEPVANLCHR